MNHLYSKARLLLVAMLLLNAGNAFSQKFDERLKIRARYLDHDSRILKNQDFSKIDMKRIAVLYLPDSLFGYLKVALTVFGNDKATFRTPQRFNSYADSLIKNRFEALQSFKFSIVRDYPTPEQYPFFNARGFKT